MDVFHFLTFTTIVLATGGLAGLTAGMFGVGGSVVIIPILDVLFRAYGIHAEASFHMAVGTALMTIIPTSLASIRAHTKRGNVDMVLLKNWGLAVIIGAALGSIIGNVMPGQILRLIFGVFIFCVAMTMSLPQRASRASDQPPRNLIQKLTGFLIGFISSLVGVGGGSMTVPVLTIWRMPIHRAIGTASAVGLLIALPSAIVYLLSQPSPAVSADFGISTIGSVPGCFGNVNVLCFVVLAISSIVTAPMGAKLTNRLPAQKLRMIFAAYMGIIALKMIIGNFSS
jgi:hypothetical protein